MEFDAIMKQFMVARAGGDYTLHLIRPEHLDPAEAIRWATVLHDADPDAQPDEFETTQTGLMVKYKVKAKCTVREGKDGDSDKVGEYKKGEIVEVVEEASNKLGLVVVRTQTRTSSGAHGGWVKVRTNKGKMLLEKIQAVRSSRRMSISESEVSRRHRYGLEVDGE